MNKPPSVRCRRQIESLNGVSRIDDTTPDWGTVVRMQNILDQLYRLRTLCQKAIERVRNERGDTSDSGADDCLARSHRFQNDPADAFPTGWVREKVKTLITRVRAGT